MPKQHTSSCGMRQRQHEGTSLHESEITSTGHVHRFCGTRRGL